MFKFNRIMVYILMCYLFSSLIVGCSKTKNISSQSSINDMKNSEVNVEASSSLESWIGDYSFSEYAPPNQNMFYSFLVYKENDNYYANISIDGFQTIVRLKAKVVGDKSSIKLSFYKYLPENTSEEFVEGDILLSFVKRNSQILTSWGKIKPILESNDKLGEVYFKIES